MEGFCFQWLCVIVFSYVLLLFTQKAFVHLWWTPKIIQKHFKKQGITGPKYHFLFGNLKEIASFTTPSWPSTFTSHDILPNVLPFYHHWKKIYGTYLFFQIYIVSINNIYTSRSSKTYLPEYVRCLFQTLTPPLSQLFFPFLSLYAYFGS